MKLNEHGELIEEIRVSGKGELLQVLTDWLRSSDAERLGAMRGKSRFWRAVGGTLGGRAFRLNADTTRSAIQRVVALNNPPQQWAVTRTGKAGTCTKLSASPDPTPIRGWYCYLLKPMNGPTAVV